MTDRKTNGFSSLRARAPLRVLEGFGRAQTASGRWMAPRSVDELRDVIARAAAEGLPVSFRGAGRSYGDASLNGTGLALDITGLDRMLAWDPSAGIAECEPGLTIEGLWRRSLTDGFWPAVVPGTMAPTLAGCLAMNIHGKNNFRVGPIGEHVLDFDLLTADGRTLRCSRDENADVFFAAIGGLGLMGAFTRVRLKLKHLDAGRLRVDAVPTRTLDEMFDVFEERLPAADYLVGWVDCAVGGRALGRGLVHDARTITLEEDPAGKDAFKIERQTLPNHILGVPKSLLWRFLRPLRSNIGVRAMNAVKYASGAWKGRHSFLQSHVAFAFLLDYVPNWRLAYGPRGFIQYQIFAPHASARALFRDVLALGRRHGYPSYLGVLKRHRPDPFLLTHALDGWSLALDFSAHNPRKLAVLTEEMTDLVLAAGGKFYFAKDGVMRPQDAERAYGAAALDAFFALKRRLDPGGVFSNDQARRVFPERLTAARDVDRGGVALAGASQPARGVVDATLVLTSKPTPAPQGPPNAPFASSVPAMPPMPAMPTLSGVPLGSLRVPTSAPVATLPSAVADAPSKPRLTPPPPPPLPPRARAAAARLHDDTVDPAEDP